MSFSWDQGEKMDKNMNAIQEMRIARTIKALEANHIHAEYLGDKTAVTPRLQELMAPLSTCSVGGSQTLFECGVIDFLRSGDFTFYDRYAQGLGKEEIRKIYLAAFDVDYYLASANAVTEHGELYCVDNNSNRVAAMLYGPRKVILIVSTDKIVPDLAAAVCRVKTAAAPANAIRLERGTFCTKNGHCMNPTCDPRNLMALGAGACQNTVCSNAVVFGNQREDGRMIVLFVGQSIGY